jgi:hypothetical protein
MVFQSLAVLATAAACVARASADTWVYHINRAHSPPRCGQVSIDDRIVLPAKLNQANKYPLSVGTCAQNGFPVQGGTGSATRLPALVMYGQGFRQARVQLYYAEEGSRGNAVAPATMQHANMGTHAQPPSMCESHMRANVRDFSSHRTMMAAGWRFSPDAWPATHDPWCAGYNRLASTYCGYQLRQHQQAIMLPLVGSGSVTVTYRNGYHGRDCGGHVVLYVGNAKISSAANGHAMTTTVAYNDGDVLKLQDEGCTVILLTGIVFWGCNVPGSLAASDARPALKSAHAGNTDDDGGGVFFGAGFFVVLVAALLVLGVIVVGAVLFARRRVTKTRFVVGVEARPVAEGHVYDVEPGDRPTVTVQATAAVIDQALPTHPVTVVKATAVALPPRSM